MRIRFDARLCGAIAWMGCVLACSGGSPEGGSASNAAAGAAGSPTGGGNATSGGAAGTSGISGAGAVAGTGGAPAASGGSGGAASGGAASGGAASGGAASGGAASGGAGAGGSAGDGPYKGVANSECADLTTLNVAWWYNWTLDPGDCEKGEFVPMISGKNEKTPPAVASALGSVANAGYQTVLGFNEPNKADQSNMTVSDVLGLWPSITSDASIRVGSPATSADAKAWFEEFMQGVDSQSLRVDFVAIHWYGWNAGSCDSPNELENYITWAEQFERPIWITEWGCMNQSNPSPEVVEAFYSAAIAMFEEHSLIERYAWYPWNTNNGLVDAGSLTSLGETFAKAPATR